MLVHYQIGKRLYINIKIPISEQTIADRRTIVKNKQTKKEATQGNHKLTYTSTPSENTIGL